MRSFLAVTCLLVIFAATRAHAEQQAVEPAGDHITAQPGFVVDKVFAVPRAQMGSWVSLSSDGRGRLIACDQGDKGMYLITPGMGDKPTTVEKLPVKLSHAQGITVHGDIGYSVVNGPGAGLYRLTAANNDGIFDKAELLIELNFGGEHGPHAVRVAPDGKGLFIICGNMTKLPKQIDRYRVPSCFGEDHLLPQIPDPNGHANSLRAPGGFIMRCGFDGKGIELYSSGYRNPYDMDFNADGELFAYDADMEWDLGSPWYRPTRLCHSVSGSDFGWRTGSGKWPEFYDDSLPPAVVIGPGSPTGVEYGQGMKFPAKFQKAMFLLDWTFGTMYAVHLTPDGASYKGELEEFLSGKPLPLTDCTTGDDGHMYFTTGGRNTESFLWRVRYTGDESTEPVDCKSKAGDEMRAKRHQYETVHGTPAGNKKSFADLTHSDRFLRNAARVAYESGDVAMIRKELQNGSKEAQHVTRLAIMLARQGEASDISLVVDSLAAIDLKAQDDAMKSAVMRAMALAAVRLAPIDEAQKAKLVASLRTVADRFGEYSSPMSMQWFELMVYLEAPEAVELGVAVLDNAKPGEPPAWGHLVSRSDRYGGAVGKFLANMPPSDALRVAFILRNAKVGWTPDNALRYFQFFPKAAASAGGNSYVKFFTKVREDAIKNMSPDIQTAVGSAIAAPLNRPMLKSTPPKGPGREWTKQEALKAIANLRGANFNSGRNLFHATGCIKCHRFDGEGEAIGPDVSSVGTKFSQKDLIESIIEPSKTISDQYGSNTVYTTDGKVINGRVVEIGDMIRIHTAEYDKPPIEIKKDMVDEIEVSKTSQMPKGLIDQLNEKELRDLIAYLLSGGNARAKYFKK